MSIMLRPFALGDIPALMELAPRIWRKHYPGIISNEQTEYMIAELYNPDALAAQLQQENVTTMLAWDDSALVGFLTIKQLNVHEWFISRFYVDTERHGQGIGTRLFDYVAQQMKKGDRLHLKVNRDNKTAVEYYFRKGFAIESSEDKPFGPYVLNDYVMVKTV